MPNVDAPDLGYQIPHAHAFGDCVIADFDLSNITLVNGSVLRAKRIPKGAIVIDSAFSISAVGGVGCTGDFGLVYADGTVADPDLFSAAPHNLNTGTFFRNDAGLTPFTCAKDAFLALTIAGADVGGARGYKGWVSYRWPGLG